MVLSQWCLGGVPMVFRWCSVSRCCLGVALLVRLCLGRVPVVSQWCPGRVPAVCRWCCNVSSGVPVVSRRCPGGCWWCSTTFHPVVPRLCPVFHGVVSRSRPPFRKICNCGAVGVLLARWLEGLRWGGEVVGVLFGDACSVLYVIVIGVSVGALALKKLARTFLLSCHDVFAELVAACNSHRLLLLPVSHSPGKHYTAYLVENGFRQISRNEHLFAESISLQQFLYLPNSHQVWGLLLTRFTFVLASIFRECPILGRSMSQCRWCPRCVPAVSPCPEHHFLRSSWWPGGRCRVGVVRCWGGGAVWWNGCGVVWWCWSVIRSVL